METSRNASQSRSPAPTNPRGARARWPAIVAATFVAGGFGGALLDQIHVRAHVLRYAHPDLAGQPWWVAPQFGIAVVLIILACVSLTRRLATSRDPVPFVVDAVSFATAYVVTGAMHRHPWIILVVLLAMWAVLLSGHRDRSTVIMISLGLAIVGPIYESTLAATGAFHYTVTPLVQRVPVWLPALYLIAGVLAASTTRALNPQASAGATFRSRPAIR